jgi:hypothetical protein
MKKIVVCMKKMRFHLVFGMYKYVFTTLQKIVNLLKAQVNFLNIIVQESVSLDSVASSRRIS